MLLRITSTDPELVYYADEQGIPPYAILSHTWEEEEVTFQYIHDLSTAKNMKGYSKIMRACELARSDDYKYIWIDTCCIDKSSSAELSEAINSIVIFLGNFSKQPSGMDITGVVGANDSRLLCKRLEGDWNQGELTRDYHQYYWYSITGSLDERGRRDQYREKNVMGCRKKDDTHRRQGVLTDGIFGVFMPTIYGEGPNAFTRLQEEILKVSDDQTLFAWKPNTQSVVSDGLLATSPDDFGESGENSHNEFLALLNCRQQGTSEYLAIYVKRSRASDGHRFARKHPNVLVPCGEKGSPQELFFKEGDPTRFEVGDWMRYRSQYRISFCFPGEVILQQKYSPTPASWTDHETDKNIVYLHFPGSGSSGALLFRDNQVSQPFVVMAGVHNYNIWLDIVLDFDRNKPIDLEDVQGSYYRDNGRGDMLWKNLDRISKYLTNNKAILVEARRKGTNNCDDPPYHKVNIRIVDRMHPDVAPAVLPTRAFQYAFNVSFFNTTNTGFSLLEAYPDNFWEVSGISTKNSFLDP
ncbi:hypothetical protein BDP27DRAFT_1361734 [Rhodocollybia butyracea]|uniref:Heterokaryon incompatibility domain-containing protein n=1 Tax=Rhodocollybia butyracea TaxID=206335 RepID=A0A9P5PY71_9AGAR|nr:hypothetical protein BDP27DRAFT_1361734 [Rhodocollybia butyracea]